MDKEQDEIFYVHRQNILSNCVLIQIRLSISLLFFLFYRYVYVSLKKKHWTRSDFVFTIRRKNLKKKKFFDVLFKGKKL